MSDTIRVRRRRSNNFAAVPHQIARDGSLSDKGLRAWVVLQCYADWDDGTSYPSIATLGDDMGCSPSSVQRAIRELTDRGLLLVDSGQEAGKPNVYTVCDEPVDADEGSVTHDVGGKSPMTDPPQSPMTDRGKSPMTDKQEPCQREPEEREPGTISATSLGVWTEHDILLQVARFDEFWSVYPRKAGKAAARRKWDQVTQKVLPETIILGAERFRDDPNREDQFTPHPATWLHQGRWEDDPLPAKSGSRKSRDDSAAWGTISKLIGEGAAS